MPGANLGTALLGLVAGGAEGYMGALQKRHAEKLADQKVETQRAYEDYQALTPESQQELTKSGVSWRDPQYWKKKGDVATALAKGTPAVAGQGDAMLQPQSGTGSYIPKLGEQLMAAGIKAPGPAPATPMQDPGTPSQPGRYLETYDSAKLKNDQAKLVEQANNFALRADEANRRADDAEKNTDVRLAIANMGFDVKYDKLNADIKKQTNEYNINLGKLNEQIKKDGNANTALLLKIAQLGKAIDSLNKHRDEALAVAKQRAAADTSRAGSASVNASANKERADKYKGGGGSGVAKPAKQMTQAQANTLAHHLSDDKYVAQWDTFKSELAANGYDETGRKTLAPANPNKIPGTRVVKSDTNKVVTKIKHPASWWRQQGKAAGLTGKPLEDYVNTYAK